MAVNVHWRVLRRVPQQLVTLRYNYGSLSVFSPFLNTVSILSNFAAAALTTIDKKTREIHRWGEN